MGWQIDSPNPPNPPPDLARFLQVLDQHGNFFRNDTPLDIGRAPGRLDLMGGIADYSGSLVLEMPLAVATYAAIQPDTDAALTILSTSAKAHGGKDTVRIPIELLLPPSPLPYSEANRLLTERQDEAWVAYAAGVFVVLLREKGIRLQTGLRVLIHSEVPLGKGVSSSAALEVAVMSAAYAFFGIDFAGREMALLCQKVENQVVGAPCGVMDQMTAAWGKENQLLALLCQPAELQGHVALPEDLEVWGIDSGIRHAVSGADYGSVRVGAFMGYRIIADLAGLPIRVIRMGRVETGDSQWGGYLANISPPLWGSRFRQQIPERIKGRDFLARYQGITDTATVIDPQKVYAVRYPTAHPIYEHRRVRRFRELLESSPSSEESEQTMGKLMFQSHESYSACGLGSDGTDRLVELVRKSGPEVGLYGAKITGGGSGGTVAILTRRGSSLAIKRIAEAYEKETGRRAEVFAGSSPGALEFGSLVAEYKKE
jgi:L-arabinokinase